MSWNLPHDAARASAGRRPVGIGSSRGQRAVIYEAARATACVCGGAIAAGDRFTLAERDGLLRPACAGCRPFVIAGPPPPARPPLPRLVVTVRKYELFPGNRSAWREVEVMAVCEGARLRFGRFRWTFPATDEVEGGWRLFAGAGAADRILMREEDYRRLTARGAQ